MMENIWRSQIDITGLPKVDSQCHGQPGSLQVWNDGWMGGRVVEGGSLENCCTRKGTLGSNPSPSVCCCDGRIVS